MVSSRLATAAAGVVVSLAVSAVLWWYFDVALFLLAVPFVPFLFRSRGGDDDRPSVRSCPECGFRTRNPSFEHCPRDGTRLREN
ncbi:hypothetical protein [Halobacterium jilantaiense]|uniref:Uncharacterized protein n=1 Tax=Halobacterium jilantaiense TaxID=355548 RepID=A0A1I0QRL6_9EURY|nr:hypothetical protein [Halobacterium jilantaiense]SEW30168.1 hypothetical protein SAMN04487945_2900 [Halobacterium jilantaiense]